MSLADIKEYLGHLSLPEILTGRSDKEEIAACKAALIDLGDCEDILEELKEILKIEIHERQQLVRLTK